MAKVTIEVPEDVSYVGILHFNMDGYGVTEDEALAYFNALGMDWEPGSDAFLYKVVQPTEVTIKDVTP